MCVRVSRAVRARVRRAGRMRAEAGDSSERAGTAFLGSGGGRWRVRAGASAGPCVLRAFCVVRERVWISWVDGARESAVSGIYDL